MKKLTTKMKIRQVQMLKKNLKKMGKRKHKIEKDKKEAAKKLHELPRSRQVQNYYMKKLLGILVLDLLITNTSKADQSFLSKKKYHFPIQIKQQKNYLSLLMNLISHGNFGYESSSSSKKKEKKKKRKTCSLTRSLYSRECSHYREKPYRHLIINQDDLYF